jgi:hypothetical protein
MLALDLFTSVASTGAINPNRLKDIKTALNKLADACQTPLEALDLASVEATYPELLHTYFTTLRTPASAHTRRNTLQNLGQLYRAAHDALLLAGPAPQTSLRLPPEYVARREMHEQSPYRAWHSAKARVRYGLPLLQWPAEIRETWELYADMKALQVRAVTLRRYTDHLKLYLGYNLRHDPHPPSRWDQLFELPRIRRYVTWKAARVNAERISSDGKKTVIVLVDIAKHQERPDYAALQKFKRSLARPAAVLNKKAPRHTVSLVQLDRLGLTLMAEARQPLKHPWGHEKPGLRHAVKFMTGLLIRLLLRCPRRAKEVREMDFDDRLYKDEGVWYLHYKSHQLKIAVHDGHPNEFRMEWPADLVEDFTEYLEVFRPMILGSTASEYVFPTQFGTTIQHSDFWRRIVLTCWARLHKHVFPHLFRTLWCDAYLDANPGDYEGAAAMLNDKPETVRAWYRQFRVEQHLKNAINFNAQLFGNGQGKAHGRRRSR